MSSRLSLFAAALLAAVAASAITLVLFRPAASQQRVIRTQAVEIIDGAGQVRITLDAFGGKPAVWLYDGSRQRRLALTISAQGVPEVALYDGHGQPRMLIRVGAERVPCNGVVLTLRLGFAERPKARRDLDVDRVAADLAALHRPLARAFLSPAGTPVKISIPSSMVFTA